MTNRVTAALFFVALFCSQSLQAAEALQTMEMQRQLEPAAVSPRQRAPETIQRRAPLKKRMDPLPDYAIVDLTASPNPAVMGGDVTLAAKVHNSGFGAPRPVPVRFFDVQNGKKLGEAAIVVGAGKTSEVSITVRLLGRGRAAVRAVVNPDGRIAESNMKNNEGTTVVTLTQPVTPPFAKGTRTGGGVAVKAASAPGNVPALALTRNTVNQSKRPQAAPPNLPGGSAAGSGGGMAGPPGAPGGIQGPGSGNSAPPFGDGDDGIPGVTNPTGMGRPGDKIVTPDQMGDHTPGGSYGNLYGGVNPARDPRQGGGRGTQPTGIWGRTTRAGVLDIQLVFDPEPGPAGKQAEAAVVVVDEYFVTIYYFNTASDGSVMVDKVVLTNESTSNSIEGFGDRGDQNPLSEADKRRLKEFLMQQAYDAVKNGPVIQQDGGVVDPVRNQANADGSVPGSENSSGQGKAPMAAKAPGSQKPGSLLTGGGRIDTDKGSAQVKLPQGFQVIDPPANAGAAAAPADAGREQPAAAE